VQGMGSEIQSGLVDLQIRPGRWPVPVPVALTGVDGGIVKEVLAVLRGAGVPAQVINGESVLQITVMRLTGASVDQDLDRPGVYHRVAFSPRPGDVFVRRYLGAGGTAVFANDQGLILARGNRWWLVSPTGNCRPGAVIAAAVCAGLDLEPKSIGRGLQELGGACVNHDKSVLYDRMV